MCWFLVARPRGWASWAAGCGPTDWGFCWSTAPQNRGCIGWYNWSAVVLTWTYTTKAPAFCQSVRLVTYVTILHSLTSIPISCDSGFRTPYVNDNVTVFEYLPLGVLLNDWVSHQRGWEQDFSFWKGVYFWAFSASNRLNWRFVINIEIRLLIDLVYLKKLIIWIG